MHAATLLSCTVALKTGFEVQRDTLNTFRFTEMVNAVFIYS